jgi:hypothetical protein
MKNYYAKGKKDAFSLRLWRGERNNGDHLIVILIPFFKTTTW